MISKFNELTFRSLKFNKFVEINILGRPNKFKEFLFKEESAASLGLFRILVGLVLMIQIGWFIATDFFKHNLFNSVVRFKFYYFQFLEPLTPVGMNLLLIALLISTVFIIIGKYFRISIIFFGLGFTYIWLLDKSYFNNHYYLISLIALLLSFTNAERWGTLKKKANSYATVPNWQIFIIKFQIFIVFFIAGVNKLNYYWLFEFQPMKHILETKAQVDGYPWLASHIAFFLTSWLGLLFDLSIGFLIWWNKTRKMGIVIYILFNLFNFWLFYDIGEIGIFPFFLLACLAIFLNPKWIESKIGTSTNIKRAKSNSINNNASKKGLILICITTYIVLQLLIPFRHLLYQGHVDWTGRGQRFSWRMKIMYKDPDIHFYLIDEGSEDKLEVNVGSFLNSKQYTNLIYYPDFIPPVAKHIRAEGRKRGMKNPKVVSNFQIGFMGHPKNQLVNPNTDLSEIEFRPFENPKWLLPPNK